jgi:pimeloyl-ACP methyl ester carboxylesterase
MNKTEPIQPPNEPCSKVATNPMNSMLSLGAIAKILVINRSLSLRQLGALLGISNERISLREALLKGTWLAIQPEMIEPPAEFIVAEQEGRHIGRLIPYLRGFAQNKNPRKTLVEAAIQSISGKTANARALADLAVTGRLSYEKFAQTPLNESMLVSDVKASFASRGLPIPSDTQIMSALTYILDRAYNVAFALRGPYPERAALRSTLSWIAVSGEDDPPHRPLNTISAPYPQYEIPVSVGNSAVSVKTRFFIASPPPSTSLLKTTSFPSPRRSLPPDTKPVVPDGDRVILFVHGHSSRAEEALELIPWLHQAGLAHGTRFSVICMDLPSNGYSSMIDHSAVALSGATTFPGGLFDSGPIKTPILDFIEDFIVAFVEELDHYTPIKNRFAGVIGGSLGGNMGLRLGRRDLVKWPWLAAGIVSWDPASVWTPFVRDEIKRHAPEHCREKWDEAENDSFSRYNYFTEVFDGAIYDSAGKEKKFDELIANALTPVQPKMWYRDDWKPCKDDYIFAARTDRFEIYHQYFRRWHWRVAGEQLIYSHVAHVKYEDSHSPYRYELNRARQLLAAGEKDNYNWANIYNATRELAEKMVKTPGRSLFLLDTGHSIHAERPRYLADQIASFFTVEAR